MPQLSTYTGNGELRVQSDLLTGFIPQLGVDIRLFLFGIYFSLVFKAWEMALNRDLGPF